MIVLDREKITYVHGGVFGIHDMYMFPLLGMFTLGVMGQYMEREGMETALWMTAGGLLGLGLLIPYGGAI